MNSFSRIHTATLQHACNVATLHGRRLPGCCNTTPGKKPLRVFSRRVARHGVALRCTLNANPQKLARMLGRDFTRAILANSQKGRE